MSMNIFSYAASEEKMFEEKMADYGYERKTTFYSDLSIAECFGKKAVKDTYKMVVEQWLNDVKYFTEFVLCLNHKAWEWYGRGDEEKSKLYCELYEKAHHLAQKTFKGEDGEYYFNTTD